MKPRVFIGSSTESLDVANALQYNLDYDAVTTVWNQGIFNLSSNTLTDLLNALDEFDFAIFIFTANDISVIRDSKVRTVRDNVIFELGLFFGKLGKQKVFFITDRSVSDLHLPTDLIGTTSGTFDGSREDNNLRAALGPFCYEVGKSLKSFIYENLTDLQNESLEAKRLAVEKPTYWEHLLAIELLTIKLKPINMSFEELQEDLIVQRKRSVNYKELYQFTRSSFATLQSIAIQFQKSLTELTDSFGPAGKPGNVLEIKKAVDHMIAICKELLSWEFDVNSLSPENDLIEVKEKLRGWSEIFITVINDLVPQMSRRIDDHKQGISPTPIFFTLKAPDQLTDLPRLFHDYIIKHKITDFPS